ncbi:MAG: response regulator [Clostridia bacterium]|nr:response regulator [Clostridia bacterium]
MSLLRAIVVEDERNIREGIGTFIETVATDYEVVGLFSDGDEAIEYLEKNEVDLVLTDIRMSRISGIELVKYLYENHPRTLSVVLSGYREFEYAKSAMAYHVFDYLLKPADYGELEKMLQKAAEEIRRRNQENESNAKLEALLPELRREFFISLLAGTFKQTETIAEKASLLQLGAKFIESSCSVIEVSLVDYEDFFESKWKYGRDSFHNAIENLILTNHYEAGCKLYFVGDYHYQTACIFASVENASNPQEAEHILEKELDKLTVSARQVMSCELQFSAGKIFKNPLELAQNRCFTEEGSYADRVTLLKTYISMNSEEEGLLLARSLFDEMKGNTLPYIKGRVLEIFHTLCDVDEGQNFPEESVNRIIRAETMEEIEREYLGQITFMINCAQAAQESSHNLVIKRAKQYIEKNFAMDISLQDVAEHVYLNPVYFSKYFKEHTKKNFSDYLADVRINFAKKELVNGKKIDDVCRLSGYRNSSYFSKIFKTSTGMTPREYQRMKIGRD